MSDIIFAILIAFSSPLPLLIIERFLPYPAIIEELIKVIFISLIIRSNHKKLHYPYAFVVLAGLLFNFSESMFYLMNYLATQQLYLFAERLLLTGAMHVSTCLVLYFFGRLGKVGLLVGLCIAVAIHFIFNAQVIKLT